MKAKKLSGIRLINYITDGLNWKDHKDIILDFWIKNECQKYNYSPKQFINMYLVEQLPNEAQQKYEDWFKEYDFQNERDINWIEFVNGTLNLFYHTKDPQEESVDEWYINMMKSEVEARDIAETQTYHGSPNINAFWKIDTNSKPEEVGGRRNGYMYTLQLKDISANDTRGFYWAIVFQCPETVSLGYDDSGTYKRKCINWAADAKHMTLLRITADGRFKIEPIYVEGKVWKSSRHIPEGNITNQPLTASALFKYLNVNFNSMYGVWDKIDEKVKNLRENTNERKNALNTFNDEEIKVGKLISNIDLFIKEGNVSDARREYNKAVRQAIKNKIRQRDKELKKKIRDVEKEETRKVNNKRTSLHFS
jgi:hypothetical protein